MEIGLKIKEIRINNGIKQESIAFFLKINQGTYAKLENGKLDFKSQQLIDIASYFKVPVSSFFPDDLVPLQIKALLKEIDDLHRALNKANTFNDFLLIENKELKEKNKGI
jgi:transcriptional regulator with XRE-family HTH domain